MAFSSRWDAEFDKLYKATGRSSVAPEYVLRALLLQAFYSIRWIWITQEVYVPFYEAAA